MTTAPATTAPAGIIEWALHTFTTGLKVWDLTPAPEVRVAYAQLPDGTGYVALITPDKTHGKVTKTKDSAELTAHRLAERVIAATR